MQRVGNIVSSESPTVVYLAVADSLLNDSSILRGNSYSTFSSLVILERTLKMTRMGIRNSCGINVRWPSYAYNIRGESNGPQKWMTNMSDSSLQAISYGSNAISC
ncbi:hypothetical protein V6N13_144115 [Hibiscus sabdariffa]|uniref:Uncharacterized protein n=1 Tax=Hibiscus sabdariffa TaxID=183260 RepID=A0ABR2FJG1_9ROSI